MMQQVIVNAKFRKERKAMTVIYASLLVLLSIDGFLSDYVVSTVLRLVQMLALVLIFYNEFKLWRMGKLQMPHGFSKFVLVCLFALLLGIIVRGNWNVSGHNFFLKLLTFGGFLPYALPFCILPLPNARHLDVINKVFFIGALFSFPLWAMNIGQLVQDDYRGEGIGLYMPFFAAFLMGFPYVTKSKRKICFVIWAIYIILMLLNARRNMVFSLGCFGMIAYYCCNFSKFAKKKYQTVLMAVAALLISTLFIASNVDVLSEKVFSRFSSRVGEDTRSGVEELFLADFATSPTEDWIWGRGLDGGYYQEMRDEDTGELETNRLGIETGYLNNVLKGGILYAAVIVIVMLICLVRSIRIKNIYSVYLRWVFLLFFIDLYATVLMGAFSVKAILFWFCVSMALSRDYPYLGQIETKNYEYGKDKKRKNII